MQMHPAKLLQTGRRLGGTMFFVLLTLFFVSSEEAFLTAARLAAQLQVVPALLAGAWLVLSSLLSVTLLFGRIYCSIVCPLAIMADSRH